MSGSRITELRVLRCQAPAQNETGEHRWENSRSHHGSKGSRRASSSSASSSSSRSRSHSDSSSRASSASLTTSPPNDGPDASTTGLPLLVSGRATFAGTRLDQWQFSDHPQHALWIGHGATICVGGVGGDDDYSDSSDSDSAWGGPRRAHLTPKQEADVRRQLEQMGRDDGADGWWDRHRAYLAAILGVLAGGGAASVAGAASMKATAAGVSAAWHFGLGQSVQFSAGFVTVKAASVLTAAGPAVLVGAAVAAAVYFVPWGKVFAWFRATLGSRLWGVIKAAWERLVCFLRHLVGMDGGGERRGYGPPGARPAMFA